VAEVKYLKSLQVAILLDSRYCHSRQKATPTKEYNMATEFEKLATSPTGMRRGRISRMTPEQKAKKAEETKAKNRLRNEARRRAHIVLQYRYQSEFEELLNTELENLMKNDSRYDIAK